MRVTLAGIPGLSRDMVNFVGNRCDKIGHRLTYTPEYEAATEAVQKAEKRVTETLSKALGDTRKAFEVYSELESAFSGEDALMAEACYIQGLRDGVSLKNLLLEDEEDAAREDEASSTGE